MGTGGVENSHSAISDVLIQEAHAEGRLLDLKLQHAELSPSELMLASEQIHATFGLIGNENQKYETIKRQRCSLSPSRSDCLSRH